MKASRALIFALLPLAFAPMQAAAAPNPVLEVNPFIGTTITYDKTDVIDDFPGADLPFGMVQWSPDTPTQNAGGGYEYSDKAITGFSLTHLSGPGCSVFGDFGILPTTGAVTAPASASQPFSHVGEVAVPGYYAVTLGDPGIRAQLTVTKRTGLGRFTFPRAAQANLLFNASSDQSGVSDAGIHVIGNNEIDGYATTGHFCGMPNVYSVYFVGQFDRPFSSYGTWKGARVQAGSAQTSGAGSGGWVSFDASSRPIVEMKVGLSFVSEAGALANLRAENRGWDIVAVRNAAAAAWQRILGRIAVQGGTPDEQHIFYTALYHALLHPNVDSDVTGQYPGFDGAIHRVAQGHAEYANFSGWDIYRTQATLMALLAPRQASDAGQSLVDAAEQGGWLPKWPVVNGYSAVMAGDPADTILATYFAFGARGFDTRAALAAMVKGATDEPRHAPGQGWYVDRLADDEYLQRGYVVNSHTTNVSPVPNGASETLEYAIADFSLAQFARSLGAMSVYHRALRRSQNWANVFDTATGLIAPRDAQGAFMQTPITPDGQSGFQEGNAAQYTWMTQQDYRDLIRGMGGPAATIRKLDTYFSQRNAGQSKPYAWMGNEPSIGDPFVYLAAGEPWRAQQVLRDVQTTQWFNLPQGLCGNDDLGTMSAWYVWNAIGLYPENPAVRGFAIGTPLFTRAVVRPPHGPAIEIDAPGASDSAMYIQSLQVNGRSSQRSWIALPQSGTLRLHFVMGSAPNTAWGTQPQDAPPSYAETPVTFPRATLAALVPRTVDAAVGAGDAASIAFEVTNARAATPVSVRWRAVSPAGIRTIPDSGSVTVPAGGSTTVSAMLSGASLAPGYYDVAIDASTSDGAVLHHIDAVASVGAATQMSLAYAENRGDGSITPIDYRSGGAGPAIAVCSGAQRESLTPDHSRLFVLCGDAPQIDVIDTLRQSVVSTIPAGKNPHGLAMAPDGATLWVAQSDGVQAIDTRTLHAGTVIPLADTGALAFAPDGATLYVVNPHLGTVTPVNVRTGTAAAPIPVGSEPDAIAVSPDGRTLYVTLDGSDRLAVIDAASGTVSKSIPAGVTPWAIALAPGGRRAYIADWAARSVLPIDLVTGAAGAPIVVGGGPHALAVTPDGSTLLVVTNEDDAVVPVDTATGARGAPIRVGRSPIRIAL